MMCLERKQGEPTVYSRQGSGAGFWMAGAMEKSGFMTPSESLLSLLNNTPRD